MTFEELAQQPGAKRVATTEALPSFDELKKRADAKPVPRQFYRPNTLASGEDAVRNMSTGERFMAGLGAGFNAVGKNVADVAGRATGIEALRPDAQNWAEERQNTEALSDTVPGFIGKTGGEIAALIPASMLLRAGADKVLPTAAVAGAPFLARMLPKAAQFALNAAEGYGQGALLAGPDARNESGTIGAVLNAVGGPLLNKALGATYRGVIKPTAAAMKLVKEGVSDLTMGQMSPRSWLAQFEEAGTSSGAGGSILRAQRQRPIDQWKDVVLGKAKPPGMSTLPEGSTAEKLSAAYRGFDDAYGPIKASPLPADMGGVTMRQSMSDAFGQAANDPAILADEIKREAVEKFLKNQATVLDRVPVTPYPSSPRLQAGRGLPRAMGLPANASPSSGGLVPMQASPLATSGIVIPPGPVIPPLRGSVPAAAVQEVRTNIRKELAQQLSGSSPDYTTAKLLGGAEESLTNALDTHLPKDAAAKLRATDAQYRKYKVVEDAVRNAGDAPDGFRPIHLERAIKAAQEGGSFARGEDAGLGELRNLSSAGREVFDTRVPLTGARYLTAGPAGWVTSPLAALANVGLPKRLLTGTTVGQLAAQKAEEKLLQQASLAHALRMATLNAATPGEEEVKKRRDQFRALAAALGAR